MNNVKMRSTNKDGQTVEVRDHSAKIPTMFETRVMPKFKVLVEGNEIAETEYFQQAKFIFKNQL
ncbi:hypothetical protein GCM10010912_17250 [Paenibacillus albidus]|uniref:Uncharacterized protein n=1 Tax=Paenibacillus albidus TaxID=2041023 RepID=A0A917C551_9BACL|nr:hypothetical protein [Paenibacillus albidus]GGF72613.1 hypothetical protein GCM10010912_17250 [Paenibacillus albidus]